ncbi:MAG: histidine kinase [Bacteroidales bacterium]|nr:histidine kinase [Bacteroidales bacterium]
MKVSRFFSIFMPQNRFERHLLAWQVFIVGNSLLYSVDNQSGRFFEFLTDYILSLPIIFLITYLTAYWLIPKYLLRNKLWRFGIWFLILLFVSGLLEQFKTQYILSPLIFPERTMEINIFNFFSLSRAAFFILIPCIYFITIKYSREWYNMMVLKTEEERKHLRNELKYLKAQVHPHFLLITLSNLEEIAIKDPLSAAPGIEKISEILNFILYECNVPRIRLSAEMQQIKRFIELQELNFITKPIISYTEIGNPEGVLLAPLMLFTIVEFFFKKTTESKDQTIKIDVFIEILQNSLNFSIDSTNLPLTQNDFDQDTGITNLKKRISFLYKQSGELDFRKSDKMAMVRLNLKYN